MQAAFVIEKHRRKRSLGRSGRRKENKNTMDITGVTGENVKWTYLLQVKDRR
jgi:hypothetical protein